jgi:hypothetical protein
MSVLKRAKQIFNLAHFVTAVINPSFRVWSKLQYRSSESGRFLFLEERSARSVAKSGLILGFLLFDGYHWRAVNWLASIRCWDSAKPCDNLKSRNAAATLENGGIRNVLPWRWRQHFSPNFCTCIPSHTAAYRRRSTYLHNARHENLRCRCCPWVRFSLQYCRFRAVQSCCTVLFVTRVFIV